MKKIASERSGLIMISAALLVILFISYQFIAHRYSNKEQTLKQEGRNIVQVLSTLPLEQLAIKNGRSNILELIYNKHRQSSFAYAAIVDLDGKPLAISASGSTTIPQIQLSESTNLWPTEHQMVSQTENSDVIEFRSPLLAKGELAGYFRIGFFKPDISVDLKELPFIAQLALPIFLLVPLTYVLIRRELKPLRQANIEINNTWNKQHLGTDSKETPADFQDFMQNFKHFVDAIDDRFQKLQHDNVQSQASSLAISYQRRRMESAIQSLPDAILVMDETGLTTFANSKLASVIGQPLETILNKKLHQWCNNPEITTLLEKYSNISRLQRSETIEFIPKNNPSKTIAVSAYPIFTPKDVDTICGTLVVFHDNTQEILANNARDEFIAHVAHELKSPLNVIRMYAELLSDEQGIPDEQRFNAVNVINDEVDRLAGLIGNLLNITKIEAGNIALNRQRVKFLEFLEDTFNSVARSGKHEHIHFELQLPRTLSNIHVDKELLRIAINNLLTNAVKYNRPNGKVTLSAEELDDFILIRVSDTGLGISATDQPRIFEKFYRSTEEQITQKSGHGLGLSLAKEIIELHQGDITLQSTPGEGSEFTIALKKTSTILKQVV
jgi:two-component system sensor histidine kinase VicK